MLSVKNKFITAAVLWSMALPAFAQTAGDQSAMTNLVNPPVAPLNIFAIPAKKLFGRQTTPANMPSQSYGSYALGCMAGAQALPVTGPNWQAMRLSRNRNWGEPQLVRLVEKIAAQVKATAGWNGLLVGDMSQPRGGPMITGHASHQIGLDADIWWTPMPDRILSAKERETYAPLEMVKNRTTLSEYWNDQRAQVLKTVAQNPEVARIFVHPPIKAAMCQWATGSDRSWLAKIRPMFGHTFHFHVRMKCPEGMAACKNQWTPKPDDGTGCGKELAYWYSDVPWKPKPRDPNAPKPKPRPPLTLDGLPAQCRAVIAAP
jgi:penicillin-insensitive murein DD-endopeptidase